MSAVPHFIVCGASRSGTTWLYFGLDRHPDIYMAKPYVPEPKFFHIDALYAKGMDYYLKTWFPDVPPGATAGEKDTYYMENPQASGRIKAHLPGVKLIFILRDPVGRAYSNYLWSAQHGHEPLDFLAALDAEEERERTLPEKLKFVRPHAYFSRGLYADLLAPYYADFPAENILCLDFDVLETDPGRFLATTHRFLGVAQRPQDATGLGGERAAVNSAAAEMEAALPKDMAAQLAERYREPNRKLAALLGPGFAAWLG
jgi:hypothetical protein